MKDNSIRRAVREGRAALGTGLKEFASRGVPWIIEASGFDYCMIDHEHGAFDLETIADLVKKPDASFGPRPEPARDSLVLAALDDAMTTLSQSLGADVSQWKWGDIHLAPFKHAFVSEFDLKPARRGGDGTTVNATAGPGFEQTAGASFREIIDLSNWDNSWVTSTPGQSGQPGSPHYGDLLELWRNYEYFPLAYSRARVEKETLHVMQLVPAGR
jgi:penicillin amidase